MDFDKGTAPEVIKVLERAKARHTRVRLFLGNTETGEVWMEENDIVGYIGNSMGPVKVPILLYNAASIGGGAILTHCIMAIRDKHRWLYRHPLFKTPRVKTYRATGLHPEPIPEGYTAAADYQKPDGTWMRLANFKLPRQADRYAAFMTGRRFSR